MHQPVVRDSTVWIVVILIVVGVITGMVLVGGGIRPDPMREAQANRLRQETEAARIDNARRWEFDQHWHAQRLQQQARRAQIWDEILIDCGWVVSRALALGIVVVTIAFAVRLLRGNPGMMALPQIAEQRSPKPATSLVQVRLAPKSDSTRQNTPSMPVQQMKAREREVVRA